jgi:putative copper export protein
MRLASAVLWLHVISGAVWVGACACFVLAASALSVGSDEWQEFALKAVPGLDRLNFAAASILVATGILNLLFAGAARGFYFSSMFLGVLAAKIALLIVMVFALAASFRAETQLRDAVARGDRNPGAASAIRRYTIASGLTVAAGILALGLGLWLAGS